MRALRFHGRDKGFRLEDVPISDPDSHEVLIRVRGAGLCHREARLHQGTASLEHLPMTIGHEVIGTIEEVRPGTSPSRIGERVAVYYYAGCGTCESCRQGEENLCPGGQMMGVDIEGGHAEYATVPAQNAVPLPTTVDDVEAVPIVCDLTEAVHAADKVGIK